MTKTFIVGYRTDDPAPEYSQAIRKAKTPEELHTTLKYYKIFAADAIKQAKEIIKTQEDLNTFHKHLKNCTQDAKQQTAEYYEMVVEKYGKIIAPEKLLLASLTADQFKAPWGTAFIRINQK